MLLLAGLAVWGGVLAVSGIVTGAVEGPVAPSTRRMGERLARLAAHNRTQESALEGFFFTTNAWKIPDLRRSLATAVRPQDQIDARYDLARELLWAGQVEEATAEFQILYAPFEGVATQDLHEGARELRRILRRWLVVANLRLGEEQNCLHDRNRDSCLFPIKGGGVHRNATGSRAALATLNDLLADTPEDLSSRWLLNLVHMTLGSYPEGVPAQLRLDPSLFASEADVGRFIDVAAATGSDVFGLAGGAAVEDFDADGLLDIVTSSWGLDDQLHLLRNSGNGRFEDVTIAAGLSGEVGGLNLNHADYDNDGRPDILVLRGGWLGRLGGYPPSLLRNRGDGSFEDVTEAAGLLTEHPGQTGAWADYDGDGWLDLFLGHETREGEEPHPSQLFRNLGDGTFEDVGEEVGLELLGWIKGAAWGDYDNDGRPDLFVSRLRAPNLLYRNAGRSGSGWRFEEVGERAGVGLPQKSFPAWFWDFDNDGWLDIYVASWDGATVGQVLAGYLGTEERPESSRLYRNKGDGTFEDVTEATRLDRGWLVMGANFGDIDNDGWLDLYLGTGAPDLTSLIPNLMFRNVSGREFQDVTTSGGFGHLQKGHGVAFGDLDGDGDQDIYANMGGWFAGDGSANALFENPGHGHHWVTLRLIGVAANRFAVGARVALAVSTGSGERRIHRLVGTGGSFGSSSLQLEIGLGEALAIEELEIRWPGSGHRDVLADLPMDRVIEIREGGVWSVVEIDSFDLGGSGR